MPLGTQTHLDRYPFPADRYFQAVRAWGNDDYAPPSLDLRYSPAPRDSVNRASDESQWIVAISGAMLTIAGFFRHPKISISFGESLLWFSLPCWFPNRGRSAEFCLTGDQREYSVVLPGDGAVCIFFQSPVAGLAALTLPEQSPCWHEGHRRTDPALKPSPCWFLPYFTLILTTR